MSAHPREAKRFAAALATQAMWPFVFIAMVFIYLPVQSLMLGGPAKIIALGAASAGFVAVCLSIYLLFDAALFHLMSRYPDEASGGAAVDALLARMRLKSMPERTRTLAERMEGTGRLLPLQRFALAASMVSTVAFLFLSGTQGQ